MSDMQMAIVITIVIVFILAMVILGLLSDND